VDDAPDPSLFAIEIPFVVEGRALVPGEMKPLDLTELIPSTSLGVES